MIARKLLFFFLCTAFFNAFILVPDLFAKDDILIIANKSVPLEHLTRTDVKNIFLGVKKKWPDKSNIKFITLKYDSNQHAFFLSNYVDKTPQQYTAYWRNQVFLGKGSTPSSVTSESDLIDYIKKTDGAIGYISKSVSTESVKIISISE